MNQSGQLFFLLVTFIAVGAGPAGSSSQSSYEEALEKVRQIIQHQTFFRKAARLAGEGGKTGMDKLLAKKGNCIQSEKKKARNGSSALACALFAAEKIEDPEMKADVLIEIAGRYIEGSREDVAGEVLVRAFQLAEKVEWNWHLKLSMYVRIAARYAEARQYDSALAVAEETKNREFKTAALTRIAIKMLGNGDNDLAAEALAKSVKTAKEVESEFSMVRTMIGIIDELLRWDLYEEAMLVTGAIEVDYFRGLMLEEMAMHLAGAGRFEEALEIAEGIEFPVGKVLALNAVAMSYARCGKLQEAAGVLSRTLEAARIVDEERGRIRYLIDVGGQLGSVGQKEKASRLLMELAEQARDNGSSDKKVHLLAEIAAGLARGGDVAGAAEILEEAHRIAETEVTGDFRDMELAKIAGTYVQVGRHDRALEIVKKMEDELVADSARVQIALELMEDALFDEALMTAAGIKEFSRKNYVISEVAVGLAVNGECDRACEVAGIINDGEDELKVFIHIAGFYAQEGDDWNASLVLARASRKAKILPAGRDRAGHLARIAAAYISMDQYEEAVMQALEAAAFEKAWVLKEISPVYDEYLLKSNEAAAAALRTIIEELSNG